jgi:hypothetical protein
MKYLLLMQMDPRAWEALTDEQRTGVMDGHQGFMKTITESGEFLATHALAEPNGSFVVRVRDGAATVTDGPYAEAKEYVAGYYLVECASPERAGELAAMIPDAAYSAVEVRPIMFSAGPQA